MAFTSLKLASGQHHFNKSANTKELFFVNRICKMISPAALEKFEFFFRPTFGSHSTNYLRTALSKKL